MIIMESKNKKITYDDLMPIERKWVNNWISSMAWFEAHGPKGEPLSETLEEYRTIMDITKEKLDELADIARERWRGRMLAVLSPEATKKI